MRQSMLLTCEESGVRLADMLRKISDQNRAASTITAQNLFRMAMLRLLIISSQSNLSICCLRRICDCKVCIVLHQGFLLLMSKISAMVVSSCGGNRLGEVMPYSFAKGFIAV
jgi:hypothetical protein